LHEWVASGTGAYLPSENTQQLLLYISAVNSDIISATLVGPCCEQVVMLQAVLQEAIENRSYVNGSLVSLPFKDDTSLLAG